MSRRWSVPLRCTLLVPLLCIPLILGLAGCAEKIQNRSPSPTEVGDALALLAELTTSMTLQEACTELEDHCRASGQLCGAYDLFCNRGDEEQICIALFFECRDRSQTSACQQLSQQCLGQPDTTPPPGESPEVFSWEAEEGQLEAPMTRSGEAVLQTAGADDPATAGRARYRFEITVPATYVLDARVDAPHHGANSFFFDIDAEPVAPTTIWDIALTVGYEQRTGSWRGNGTYLASEFVPKTFALDVGPHELVIAGREANTRLDALRLVPTGGADPPPAPAPDDPPADPPPDDNPPGDDPPAGDAPATVFEFEAEAGSIAAPFVASDGAVSQATESKTPAEGGRLSFVFEVTTPGLYTVTALIDAPHEGANSLFINFDGEPTAPTMIWDVEVTQGFEQRTASWRGNGTFRQSEFAPVLFTLPAGEHELVIRGREAGTRVDRVTVSLVVEGVTPPAPPDPPPSTDPPPSDPPPTGDPPQPASYPQPTVMRFKNGAQGAFTLQFDDSMVTHADVAIPEMNKRGLVGTFYVNPDTSRYQSRRSTWEQVCPQYGHELANHTMNHSGAGSFQEADYEIGQCSKTIWALYPDRSKLRSFARGGGTSWSISSAEMDQLMRQYFLVGRRSEHSISDDYGNGGAAIGYAQEAIDEQRWVPVHFHGIGGEWISVNTADFVALLDFLESKKDRLWTATYGAAYRYEQEFQAISSVTLSNGTTDGFEVAIDCDSSKVDTFGAGFAELYDEPLTVRVAVPDSWPGCSVTQVSSAGSCEVRMVDGQRVAQFDVRPNVAAAQVRREGAPASQPDPAPQPDPDPAPPPADPTAIIYGNDFNDDPLGTYTLSTLNADWSTPPWSEGVGDGLVTIFDNSALEGRSLRVRYPANTLAQTQWQLYFDRRYDELYCSFWIRFADNFSFMLGGKIPGLAGGTANSGGNKPDGTDGFEAIMMWRENGAVVQYVYHPDQPTQWGEDFPWNIGGQRYFTPGQWHHIEHRVVINTPGQKDGVIQGWFDGELALDVRDLRFRDVDTFAIDLFYFQTHFGGSGSEWEPKTDQTIAFDKFIISTERMGMP